LSAALDDKMIKYFSGMLQSTKKDYRCDNAKKSSSDRDISQKAINGIYFTNK
jgi:hypothetical protein